MLHTDIANLTDAERVDELIFQAMSAQDAYLQMDQKSVDWIVNNMARMGASKHLTLAKKAVAETGRGIVEDISITNIFASSGLEQKLQNIKTVGIVEENKVSGRQVLAEPVGILAAFPAVDHPTATILLQAILSVKTRNPIVFCFHPSVYSSSLAAAQLMQKAAVNAGAPAHAIQWLPTSSDKSINALYQNPEISLILMDENDLIPLPQVFSDIPVLGMGQINTPCFIDRSADIEQAATDVIASKYFDNGLISTSEQTVIISREVYFQTLDLLMQKSCHLASEQEKELLEQLLFDSETGLPNPECTGRDAVQLAKMAGFTVPEHTKLLLTELAGIGVAHPLSRSKAAPVLSILVAESWYEGLCFCEALLEFSSAAHTAVLHARDKNLAEEFSTKLKVTHTILNQPASRGDVCELITSAGGNNITSAGDRQAGNPTTALLSVDMLLSSKLVQNSQIRLREWNIPEKVLFSQGCINHLKTVTGMERTLIVTEKMLMDSNHMDTVLRQLNNQKYPVQTDFFCNTQELPTIDSIEKGVQCMDQFQPTAILVIGDGSTIDTAKVMRYFYQRPQSSFPHASPNLHAADFPDCQTDPPKRQISLIAVPTTLAAGTEMYASVTIFDENREKRRTLHSCELIPDVILADSKLFPPVDTKDMAITGMAILSHAFEAYVSPLASDYSDSVAIKAILQIFAHLPKAVAHNQADAREKIVNAASMAGMAAGNAKSGLHHAMVNSLSSIFRIPHGQASSLLLAPIIRYNGVEDPSRFNPLIPGSRYIAHERYHDIARALGTATNDPEKAVQFLIKLISTLQNDLNLPRRVRDYDISEEEYLAKIEQMAELAFEDHSTATNPRLPLIKEIIEIYNNLY